MKEVIRQYGGAVITSLIAIVLLALIMAFPFPGGNGVPQAMGNWLMGAGKSSLTAAQKEKHYDDFENVNDVQIIYDTAVPMIAGEWNELGKYFGTGKTENGGTKEWVLHIYQVVDERGNSCLVEKINGKEYLYPEKPGIYRVYLGASYEGKKEIRAFLNFPVQKGV